MWSNVRGFVRVNCLAKDTTVLQLFKSNSAKVLETLRGAPLTLAEVVIVGMEINADIMRELGRCKALVRLHVSDCTGTIIPLPPSLAQLSVRAGVLDDFLLAVAQSNIESLWVVQHNYPMPHELFATVIETSKLKCAALCGDSFLAERDVARYVVAAERCDVERIYFRRQSDAFNVDLRRTRKLTDFGNSLHLENDPYMTYQYTPHINAALVVRRVLVVLSARSGPAAKFAKRDGDHACMERVLKYM